MRITIEIDQAQGQAQVNVTPPLTAPAASTSNSVVGALDAGAAPSVPSASDSLTLASASAPLLAQANAQSAGAAPNV